MSDKALSKTIDAIRDAGPWLDRIFGDLVEDSVGVVADQIKYLRLKNFMKLRDKTNRLLSQRDIVDTRCIPLKFALPLIEAATLEDDEMLQELWARLLANAMDPDFKPQISSSFITVVKDFGPMEVRILRTLYEMHRRPKSNMREDYGPRGEWFRRQMGDERPIPTEFGQNFLGIPIAEWIGWENLQRLGCVEGVSSSTGRGGGRLTEFGNALVIACMFGPDAVDGPDDPTTDL